MAQTKESQNRISKDGPIVNPSVVSLEGLQSERTAAALERLGATLRNVPPDEKERRHQVYDREERARRERLAAPSKKGGGKKGRKQIVSEPTPAHWSLRT